MPLNLLIRLGVPPALLGFDPGTVSVESSGADENRAVDWVRRRDFSRVVAGIVLGMGADALDGDRLDALLPLGTSNVDDGSNRLR